MEKKNTGLVILTIILSVLVVALSGYIVYDKMLNNNDLDNNISDENGNNIIDNTENNSENLEELNFVRETRLTLIDEPNCTGRGTPLMATIEDDGNISIAQDGGAVEIQVGNAKYLYRVGILACNSFKLYYITEDNELYVIDNQNANTLNQKAVKATESKVIEFLGVEGKSDGSYLKVLLENRKIEYIKYFAPPTQNH